MAVSYTHLDVYKRQVHHGIFDHLFELTEFCQHRRAFRFLGLLDLFAGILGKCSGQRIGVTAFEKDQVLGRGAAARCV